MVLRGTGHGVSTADKVRAIAVDYVRKKYAVKGDLELEELQFDRIFYRVHGHYTDDKGMLHQFSVKLDMDGNVVE
jgi:hypothetical protein